MFASPGDSLVPSPFLLLFLPPFFHCCALVPFLPWLSHPPFPHTWALAKNALAVRTCLHSCQSGKRGHTCTRYVYPHAIRHALARRRSEADAAAAAALEAQGCAVVTLPLWFQVRTSGGGGGSGFGVGGLWKGKEVARAGIKGRREDGSGGGVDRRRLTAVALEHEPEKGGR